MLALIHVNLMRVCHLDNDVYLPRELRGTHSPMIAISERKSWSRR